MVDKLIEVPTVNDVYLGYDPDLDFGFACSSSDVVNTVLDDLGRLIKPVIGLNSFEIDNF